jgi:hypothetical protein
MGEAMKLTERKCHGCGGWGNVLFDGILRGCKGCGGSGKVKIKTGKRIPSLRESVECPSEINQ